MNAFHLTFFAACVFLAAFGIDKDKRLWSVMAASAVLNMAVSEFVFSWIDPVLAIAYCGLVECVTVAAIYRISWTGKGRRIAFVFAAISIWHSLMWIDFTTGTYLIYDIYSEAITAATILILTMGADGASHAGNNLRESMARVSRNRRPMGISGSSSVPMGKRDGDRY